MTEQIKSGKWQSQIVEGRVFELRSRSKHYPAPCALVINDKGSRWDWRIFEGVDRYGVVGDGIYTSRHNPNIYVRGIRREQFNSSRVLRRRRDLERFDADDLALIRYGYALDFTGRIRSGSGEVRIPTVCPADWTVFWLPAWAKDDCRWMFDLSKPLQPLLHGAWHFENHGGCRHLGYRYGYVWATRHTGARLNAIRKYLRGHISGIIEQPVKVARWTDGQNVYTEEIRRDCPALGSRACLVQTPTGLTGIYR